MSELPPTSLRRWSWIALLVVLATLLAVALASDRWGRPLPGEATALMQAESLARDLDLQYTRADYDRFLERGGSPRDLALASPSGERITWDRPFPYALWLAPFVRARPRDGWAIANVLALAFASLFVARVLQREAGDPAALWVALFVGASAVFGNFLLARDGVFLLAATAVAWGLIARSHVPLRAGFDLPEVWGDDVPAERPLFLSWLVAGALLAVPAATRAEDGVLLLAAFFAAPAGRRATARFALFLGGAAALLVLALTAWWNGGGLLGLGTEAFRFTAETGYPLVDFPAGEWGPTVHRLAALHFEEAPRLAWGLDATLAGWNLLYLAAGRHGGLLPWFAPLLVLAFAGTLAGWRKALAIGAAAWGVLLLVLHPFDLYGGFGAVGNRLFLPAYGALWLLAGRRREGAGVALAATAVVLAVATPALLTLWKAPWTPPPVAAGEAVEPGPLARHLPYETSQRWLPGGQTVEHEGLWIRLLDDGAWAEARRGRFVLDGPRRAGLMIVAPSPLAALRLGFGPEATSTLEVEGGTIGDRLLGRDGGIGFEVEIDTRPRRHPLWLTPERAWIYLVSLQMPGVAEGVRLPFTLEVEVPVEP